jgi:hypothetical protein
VNRGRQEGKPETDRLKPRFSPFPSVNQIPLFGIDGPSDGFLFVWSVCFVVPPCLQALGGAPQWAANEAKPAVSASISIASGVAVRSATRPSPEKTALSPIASVSTKAGRCVICSAWKACVLASTRALGPAGGLLDGDQQFLAGAADHLGLVDEVGAVDRQFLNHDRTAEQREGHPTKVDMPRGENALALPSGRDCPTVRPGREPLPLSGDRRTCASVTGFR